MIGSVCVCVCACVCVRAFLSVPAYLKQIVLFVCSVMDITSSLQADALHQRGSAKRILGSDGELQLGAESQLSAALLTEMARRDRKRKQV